MHTLLYYSKENRKEILSYRTKRVGKKRFKSMIYQDFSVYFALLLDLFVCLLYYKVDIGGELKR